MNVKDYLVSQGLSAEDAATIADNPTYASVYEKLAKDAEEGKTALLKAQEVERSLKDWNEKTVVPYVREADEKVAKIAAEKTAMLEYMKTMKAQGYDVPDAWLDGSSTPAPSPSPSPTPGAPSKDYDALFHQGQLAQMELLDIQGEVQELTGKRVSIRNEYEAMGREARPGENFRQYMSRKYDLDGLRAQKESAAKAAYEQKIRDEAVAAAKAEWQQQYGANPETRVPVASKFDRVLADRGQDGQKTWMTAATRKQSNEDRLKKYSSLIQ